MKSVLVCIVLALGSTSAIAAPPADDGKPWPEAWFEIFKLAPGKHEAFMRLVARGDEVLAAGGQPPVQLFVHQDGADWDILVFKPEQKVKPTAAQQAAMDAKSRELEVETGPAYFIQIRSMIAEHTDTVTQGPISAGQWLARLDAWRAAHPDVAKAAKTGATGPATTKTSP
ncbi:MAG: hypothetical protein WDO72_16290 [Pseudomonadota bacterium]